MRNVLTKLRERATARSDASVGSGASDEAIAIAESKLLGRFPDDYREFLRAIGWYEDASLSVFGLGDDCPEFLNLTSQTKWEREMSARPLSLDLVPISNDGAGNLHCLSVKESGVWGQVVFVEAHRDRPETFEPAFLTFADFLLDRVARH